MSRESNPFIIGRYAGSYYFCDRVQETEFLIKQIVNGRDIAIISPRRMGKTGLIKHLFSQKEIKDNFITLFIDIYSTSSLADFVSALGAEVYRKIISKNRKWTEKLREIVKSASPKFSVDSITGEPSIGIDFDTAVPEITLGEIFEYLDNAPMRCIVAMDEFQQSEQYSNSNVPALLRTHIQNCNNARFIFAGSEQSIMNAMFLSPAKPFYQSCVIMGLEPIPVDKYVDFVMRRFLDYGKVANPEIIKEAYDRYEGCTWFVQMMCNELFAMVSEKMHMEAGIIPEAEINVIGRQAYGYSEIMARLSPRQREVMKALAAERGTQDPLSGQFINKYRLHSPSSVQSALRQLIKIGFVTNHNGKTRIYDYFFASWLRISQNNSL